MNTQKTPHLKGFFARVYPENEENNAHHCFSNACFADDKINLDTKEFTLLLDGVILNKSQLINSYAISNWPELVMHLYQKNGANFPALLKGDFCGFVYDKQKNVCLAFTNPVSTKPVFYTHNALGFWVSTSLIVLADELKKEKQKIQLNTFAAYNMLSFGYLHENTSYIENVFRLRGGESIVYNTKNIEIKPYIDWNAIEKHNHSDAKTIEHLDELFCRAVALGLNKDQEHGHPLVGTISGGLDSRMVVFIAHKLGYKWNKLLCASQSNYVDHLVAEEIAAHLEIPFHFYPLNNANHLETPTRHSMLIDGLVLFSGSAHLLDLLEKHNKNHFGLLHGGQLGKLGGLVTSPNENTRANLLKKAYSKSLAHKIEHEIDAFANAYCQEDVCHLYNRIFNGTNGGNFMAEHKNYFYSPFYESEFLSYSVGMTQKQKYRERIYYQWLKTKHPEMLNYVWEGIKMKPNKWWKIRHARNINRLKSGFQRKVLGLEQLNTMTPENLWFKNSKHLQNIYADTFNQQIEKLNLWPELRKDAEDLYKNGNFDEKAEVLTLLTIINSIFE
jgi:asparagine synthase (glutamine-hydrolysing)